MPCMRKKILYRAMKMLQQVYHTALLFFQRDRHKLVFQILLRYQLIAHEINFLAWLRRY